MPTAVIRPGETAIESLAVHELAHWMYSCVGYGTVTDPYDKDHVDPIVWSNSEGESVESIAMSLLSD